MSNNNVKEYPFIVTFYPDEENDGKTIMWHFLRICLVV